MKKIAYCAIDYRLKHLSIAVMIKGKKQFSDVIRVPNDDRAIKKYMKTLSGEFESKACYEASSSGYAFQTKMSSWGYHCEVIAPAVIQLRKQRPPNHALLIFIRQLSTGPAGYRVHFGTS